MEKYSPMFMKKTWKMYSPMFMQGMGMDPSLMQHKGVKIAILMALKEQQKMGGYAIMKYLEDKYGRLLQLDTVYSTLRMLEDMGLITTTKQEYAITDDGKLFLEDQKKPLIG